jgi:hypothetical protein
MALQGPSEQQDGAVLSKGWTVWRVLAFGFGLLLLVGFGLCSILDVYLASVSDWELFYWLGLGAGLIAALGGILALFMWRRVQERHKKGRPPEP